MGKVPDLCLRLPAVTEGQMEQYAGGGTTDTLVEIKVYNAGVSRYPRGGGPGCEKAVNRRARALQGEYESKLKRLDAQLHLTPPDQTGPLVRLRSYPQLLGYVVGAFGECSTDVHKLVEILASSRAKFLAYSTGRAVSSQEMSQIIGQIRRKMSTSFIRAISLCTLGRVANIGPGSRLAAKRKEWAISEETSMRNERRAYWTVFVGRGGLRNRGDHFFPC